MAIYLPLLQIECNGGLISGHVRLDSRIGSVGSNTGLSNILGYILFTNIILT
jgi:hypothetical protein